MSSQYNWRFIDNIRGEKRINQKLDAMHPMGVIASQLKRCTVCPSNVDDHPMRYRIYCCKSEPCSPAQATCKFKLKTVCCDRSSQCHMYQHAEHASASGPVKRKGLSLEMKAAIRELVEKEVKPARIRNELVDSFILSSSAVPALKQIQNFVYNYRRSKLMNTDVVEQMEEIAAGARLTDDLSDPSPFTFGYPLNEDGLPALGDGSDEDPLVIGITTKFLLKSAARDPNTFVFHMDATFKLVTCGYPLIVCGVSDAARQFYPMAFFITSQRTVVQYTHALRSLMEIFKTVVGRDLVVRYCMGDAEDAQLNAVEQTLAVPTQSSTSSSMNYLMCFFHVVENVKKRISSLSNNSKYLVYRLIYEMHYCRDIIELAVVQERADMLWRAVPELQQFAEYFTRTWIRSKFCKWQCFWSPTGFAKMNNPVEQFNKVIKRDYTLRVRIKLCTLLTKVLAMCRHRSIIYPNFVLKPKPSTTLIARTKRLIKAKKVVVTQARQSVQFLLDGFSGRSSEYQVRSWLDPQENAKNAEEGERNNRRMERLGQPVAGWTVDLASERCDCRAFYKFGACVHLLACMKHANRKISGWPGSERRFVDRRVKRAKASTGTQRGRPAIVSHALCLD